MHIVIRLVILVTAHTLFPAAGSKLLMVKRSRFPLRRIMAIPTTYRSRNIQVQLIVWPFGFMATNTLLGLATIKWTP